MIRRESAPHSVALEESDDELQLGRMDGTICDENECWNEQRWKLIETNKRTVWHRSIRFLLALHNYDPYAIFKCAKPFDCACNCCRRFGLLAPEVGEWKRKEPIVSCASTRSCDRYMIGPLRPLRLPSTRADQGGRKYTRVLRYYVILFFIKSLIICTIQHANLSHQLMVPRGHKPPWLSMDQIELVSRYLGNPLQVLQDTSMLLYSAPAGLCVVSLVLIPLYYERYPMDIAILRFILDPIHELKRVDLNIRRKLHDVRISLDVFASERESEKLLLAHNNRRCHKQPFLTALTFDNARKLLEFEMSYCEQLKAYLDEFDRRLYRLRPHTFSAKYFQECSAKMSTTVAAAHFVYIFCSTVMISATELPAYIDHCGRYRQELAVQNLTAPTLCNPVDIYTRAELLLLGELALILILCYASSALNLALFSLVSANQDDLLESIRGQLVRCRQLTSVHDSSAPISNDPSDKKEVGRRLSLDKSGLESLIRLMACENELRANARSMSELTVHAFYYAVGTILFLVIVSGQFHITESQASRSFIMIATWINVNAVAISCAHIFSRVIKSERLMWSILAAQAGELLRYNQSNRSWTSHGNSTQVVQSGPGCCKCYTFVTNLWVKFVLATSANIERYCARPLLVKLTYERIIELNFFVVFIYSLSQGLPHRR